MSETQHLLDELNAKLHHPDDRNATLNDINESRWELEYKLIQIYNAQNNATTERDQETRRLINKLHQKINTIGGIGAIFVATYVAAGLGVPITNHLGEGLISGVILLATWILLVWIFYKPFNED